MLFCVLNGITVPVSVRKAGGSMLLVGDRSRTSTGYPRETVVGRRGQWAFGTPLKTRTEMLALRGLIDGDGFHCGYEVDVNADAGLVPTAGSPTPSISGVIGRYGKYVLVGSSLTYALAVGADWTVLSVALYHQNSSSYVQRIVRSDGAKWVAGVRTDGSDTGFLSVTSTGVQLLGPGRNSTAWAATTAYTVGQQVREVASANGGYFECTVAGTSGGAEPTWVRTTIGVSTTTDGTVTWVYKGDWQVRVEDLVFLPFRLPDSWVAQVNTEHSRRGWSALPKLRATGNFDSNVPHHLYLPGTTGAYASTPDAAANRVTGDICITAKVALDDWTPAALSTIVSKRSTNTAYQLRVTSGALGRLEFLWSENGSTIKSAASTASPVVSDGGTIFVAAALDVDNGAAGNDVRFYTSPDGVVWTQLGATVTTAGVTSIFAGTAPLMVGAILNAGVTDQVLAGKVHSATVRSGGLTGTVVARFSAADGKVGFTSFAAGSTGETWTINGTAALEREPVTVKGEAGESEYTPMMSGGSRAVGEQLAFQISEAS
jgi:hypothetical protein